MSHTLTFARNPAPRETAIVEGVSVLVGLGVTFGLFFAISHFKAEPTPVAPPIEDLRAVSLPPEPPPPKVVLNTPPLESPLPFVGLDVAASDSAVKIAVLPPDLDSLVPKTNAPPPAVIQTAQLITSFKPKLDVSFDFNRVFQPSEVDQRTAVLSRPEPRWPRGVKSDVHTLRVVFLLVVSTHGAAENVRLLNSSGNPEFDAEVEAQVREEWVFSPAMKNGRKVRCLVQQSIVVTHSGSSPFHL